MKITELSGEHHFKVLMRELFESIQETIKTVLIELKGTNPKGSLSEVLKTKTTTAYHRNAATKGFHAVKKDGLVP